MILREDLQIREYRQCTFLPYNEDLFERGLYDRDGRFIPKSGRRDFGGGYVESDRILDLTVADEISEDVVYLGYLMLHYGHFLIDSMIRFWIFVLHPEYRNYRIVYSYYRHTESLPAYADEILRTLTGAADDQMIFVDHPVRLTGRVIVPEWSYEPGSYIATPWQKTFDAVASKVTPKGSGKRLYLSRGKLSSAGRQEFGERMVEEILQTGGFEILWPETMSLTEQIACYRSASLIVSTNGTLAHNILWCAPECRQVLLSRIPEKNMHQDAIDLLRGKESMTIDCAAPGSDHDNSCLILSEGLLAFMKEEGCTIRYNRLHYHIDRLIFGLKKWRHRQKKKG